MPVQANDADAVAFSGDVLVSIIKIKAELIHHGHNAVHRRWRHASQYDAAINQHILNEQRGSSAHGLPKVILVSASECCSTRRGLKARHD